MMKSCYVNNKSLSWACHICITTVSLLYFYLNRRHGYLEKLSLPHEKAFLCFGSPPILWYNYIHHFYFMEAFKRFKSQTFTRYNGSLPTLTTMNPMEKIKDKNLLLTLSDGSLWKLLRKDITPVFTSGKLKEMMEPVSDIANQFVAYIETQSSEGKSIKIQDKFQGLTLDIINACAYGIKTNSSEEPDHELLRHSKIFPGMFKYVDMFGKANDELIKIANSIIETRESHNIEKKDFLNVLVQMRKKSHEDPNTLLNDEIITAQAIIFFIAGYSTTSTTLCCLTYMLATHPEIQEKLYKEIVSSEDKDFSEHSYTSAVIKETLRMYPPVALHLRVCAKDTEVEGIPIKKGTIIEMPIYASHYNPEFFPNPNEFKPERFFQENNLEIIPNTYRPFGNGNRSCIAYRLSFHILVFGYRNHQKLKGAGAS
ncbi:CYP3A [Lepeophtheirus salmonis]|uniref:CYP3A n=1 Tax=Lepeophtheirus salmonis TaxID=72036 RepID=A0A7R8D7E9_LEPSM|nr:CYP3A [Lepeophtheirus salmonis]CAF3025205.1 CYP3A [Lepeophtheirus salmonis]